MTKNNTSFPLSFEFFPPKTEQGLANLIESAKQYALLEPEYFSITFGAAGSEQARTLETALLLNKSLKIPVAPHLTCVNQTKDRINEFLQHYQSHQIDHLIILRGDQMLNNKNNNDFKYAADLVKYIRKTTGHYFYIDVAAYPEVHPQAQNANIDIEHFKEKIESGANGAITQYFYNIDAYIDFVERCQKNNIDIPIVPGIMPIYNSVQLQRFSDICGAELPRWIRKKIEILQDNETHLIAFGIDFVSELCNKLINLGTPGIHFYTLNRSDVVLEIYKQLDIFQQKHEKKPILSR